MKHIICAVVLLFTGSQLSGQNTTLPPTFDINAAERFANLALACVHKEYPNKLAPQPEQRRGCGSAAKADARVLRLLRLWHSSVHGTLVAGTVSQDLSTAASRRRTRGFAPKPDRRKY